MGETKPKFEVVEYEGREARLYQDGSIRDASGHMLAPLPGGHTITQADASLLAAKRVEQRRAAARQAANAAVQRGDFRAAYGDLAFLAEIVYSAQLKSQNVDDTKQIEAGRFVLEVTGESEKLSAGAAGGLDGVPLAGFRGLLRDLAGLLRAGVDAAGGVGVPEIVEGEVK